MRTLQALFSVFALSLLVLTLENSCLPIVSAHPEAPRTTSAQITPQSSIARNLWSHFSTFSDAVADPVEMIHRQALNARSRKVQLEPGSDQINAWWRSVADSVPPAFLGPAIAVDPTSINAETDEKQKASTKKDDTEDVEFDQPDGFPAPETVEDPTGASHAWFGQAKPAVLGAHEKEYSGHASMWAFWSPISRKEETDKP